MTSDDATAGLVGLHKSVAHDFADLLDKRFQPMLRETVNGLADRGFAAALAEVEGGAFSREIDRLVTQVATAKVRALATPEGGPTDRLVYRNVETFCTEFFFEMYQRDVQGSSTTKWCPKWWRHGEAIVRLEAIWRSWEKHSREPDDGISTWLLYHVDPNMRVLMDPDGPFKYCDGGEGHYYKATRLEALPHSPAPSGVFTDADSGELLEDEFDDSEFAYDWLDETDDGVTDWAADDFEEFDKEGDR